jgi:hypothetical protein
MIVRDDIRKCVVFLGYRLASGAYVYAGTAFFLGRTANGNTLEKYFLVTARHVIEGIRKLALQSVFVRANMKDGSSVWKETSVENWFFSSDASIDVALLPIKIANDVDHVILPYSYGADQDKMSVNEVGLGDEVFITGLFRHHTGSNRNIPIVRVGNLAGMPEEKIVTRGFGAMEGYLIECRSIGGLSGSPVFVNLGNARVLNNELRIATNGPRFFLLGLVHGHFDVTNLAFDSTSQDANQNEKINSGIAVVVPFSRIDSVVLELEGSENLPIPDET